MPEIIVITFLVHIAHPYSMISVTPANIHIGSPVFWFWFYSPLPSLMLNNKHDSARLFTYSGVAPPASDTDILEIMNRPFTFLNVGAPSTSSVFFFFVFFCSAHRFFPFSPDSLLSHSHQSPPESLSPLAPLLLARRWIEYVSYWMWMNKASHPEHTSVTPY